MARIAVAGAGVSGLVAAWRLSRDHEVTVFEVSPKLGGHVDTHVLREGAREVAVDSGFIIYNEVTYPCFTALLRELGVAGKATSMGLSVRDDRSGLEYNRHTLASVFAQRSNLASPGFLRMIAEAIRFNRQAREVASGEFTPETTGEFLERGGYSRRFREHYLRPMIAAIWSQQGEVIDAIPFWFVARFFGNHGFSRFTDLIRWKVVDGGSATYVRALVARCRARFETGCGVLGVRRGPDFVEVETPRGTECFDQLVMALHAPDALRALRDPSNAEREVLGSIAYAPNRVVVHTDASILPRRPLAHASWNYLVTREGVGFVTYDLSLLQGLGARETYLVSLNPPEGLIAPERVLKTVDYEHPCFDGLSLRAQARRSEIQGVRRTHYVGAYWGNGFHEDGVRSAHEIEVRA